MHIRKPLLCLAAIVTLALAAPSPARAECYHAADGTQVCPNIRAATGAYSGATVGTTASTVLAASTATVFLDLVNNSGTATICVNFGATATIAAGVCAAGEITLAPLAHRSWEGTFLPSDAVSAIASAASTPMSVGAK